MVRVVSWIFWTVFATPTTAAVTLPIPNGPKLIISVHQAKSKNLKSAPWEDTGFLWRGIWIDYDKQRECLVRSRYLVPRAEKEGGDSRAYWTSMDEFSIGDRTNGIEL